MGRHEDQIEVHAVNRWTHADAAARAAETVITGDIGKVSWQTDDDSLWWLGDTGPDWIAFSGGDQGDTGIQGDTGVQGIAGDTGVQGIAGDTGVQGITGDTGADSTVQGDTGVGVPANGEMFLTAAGGWPSTTNGCAGNIKNEYVTNDIDLFSLDFDQTTDEFAQWSILMPNDWDGGTVTATFLWTADSGSGDVIWGLQGRSYANDEAIDQAWGTAQVVTDTLLLIDDMHFTPVTAAITLAGTPAAGEFMQFRVYRDADAGGDTLAADAKLLGVLVNFTRA